MVNPIGGALSGAGGIERLITPTTSLEAGERSSGFESVLGQLSQVQQGADGALTDLAVNSDAELHDVVLAVEMESLAFDLAVQIRNRLVDAYQEIFRMSV